MPELSVIIPTYNRAASLRCCLDALGMQSVATNLYEVIVVIDGATDDTLRMLDELQTPFPLRVVCQRNSGQAVALNRGIAEALGRICVFVDDDIMVSPQWLAGHREAHRAGEETVAVGQLSLDLPAGAGWYARAFAEGWRRHYDALNRGDARLTWEDCYSGNMSAPRSALLACGGFDASLPRGFDVELAHRLEQRGSVLKYLPDALGTQFEQKGFPELSRDIENAGFADFEMFASGRGPCAGALHPGRGGHPLKALLTRILLGLRVSPRLLASAGGLIPSRQQQYRYHSLIQNLCYWRGVRRASRSIGTAPPTP